MRFHLIASWLVAASCGAAITPASATDGQVTVNYSGGQLLIPAQMFREETDPSTVMNLKEVALRLGYPELKTSRRPSKKSPGYQELIPLDDAIGMIILEQGAPIAIPYEKRFLTPVKNDLDSRIEFTSYTLMQKGLPKHLTHYIYYQPGKPQIYVGCTGLDAKLASCSMFFDELGLRWGIVVSKRFLLRNVREFHARLVELIRSFQPK